MSPGPRLAAIKVQPLSGIGTPRPHPTPPRPLSIPTCSARTTPLAPTAGEESRLNIRGVALARRARGADARGAEHLLQSGS